MRHFVTKLGMCSTKSDFAFVISASLVSSCVFDSVALSEKDLCSASLLSNSLVNSLILICASLMDLKEAD